MSIRVLLADDQELLRFGFRTILSQAPGIEVVAEAGDGAVAIELAARLVPDVVVMDIRMPVTDGIAATRQIVESAPSVRVLAITTFDMDEYALGVLHAGASGFILKDVRPRELVEAVRTVAAGDAVVSPRITRLLLDRYAPLLASVPRPEPSMPPAVASLTEREHEVLRKVADGLSNAEIAAQLFVSEATVKSHVGRILSKLDLRDRVQAVVLAYEIGLVRPAGEQGP
ncbi:MAG TPA: response regulator transcription factor [Acidimicrobiales bacterium]|jgi:DNA-binding NarL/FixJ family response regulator